MCFRYQIYYACTHILPLDPEPTRCSRLTDPNINSLSAILRGSTCPIVHTPYFSSPEVCPTCSDLFRGILDRAIARRRHYDRGLSVEAQDHDMAVGGRMEAYQIWKGRQLEWVERIAVMVKICEMGVGLRKW